MSTDYPVGTVNPADRALRDCRRVLRTASAANRMLGYSVSTLRTNAALWCVQIRAEVSR